MIEDRLVGAFVGLAVGDALGAKLEFQPRPPTNLVTQMVGGGVWGMPPGGWTDDTSMALCLAESLIAHPHFDPRDLMDRFVDWLLEGACSHTGTCFDIGGTTRAALQKYLATGEAFAGSEDPDTAGNGSIMRLAPVVLALHADPERMTAVARAQSRTTHAAPECLEYCERLARTLLAQATGSDLPETPHTRATVQSTGYVVDTYEAAIWATSTTGSFQEALIAAVNLGGDADTVGAVTGQIAGARYGYRAIPGDWLDRLLWRDRIEDVGRHLLSVGRG